MKCAQNWSFWHLSLKMSHAHLHPYGHGHTRPLPIPYFIINSLYHFYYSLHQGHNRKIFWVGKVIFPDFFPGAKCFFPVENFHFVRPKTNFSHLILKTEKKERKKKKTPHFVTFPPSILNISPSLSQFSFFFTPFPFFSLPIFFQIGQQKFPRRKSLLPTPACYATALQFDKSKKKKKKKKTRWEGYLART